MNDSFSIDPDELSDIVGDLTRAEGKLLRLGEDIARQMALLQSQWEGLAADAQREAQEEWASGMTAMREALAELRDAAELAHQNYTGAATTNLEMWRRVQ
jgi:WXG100 family type VII secretion target